MKNDLINLGIRGGLPHSDISGSKGACASPELFAACHVLHRLRLPRHSLNALITLDCQHLMRVGRPVCSFALVKDKGGPPNRMNVRLLTLASPARLINDQTETKRPFFTMYNPHAHDPSRGWETLIFSQSWLF